MPNGNNLKIPVAWLFEKMFILWHGQMRFRYKVAERIVMGLVMAIVIVVLNCSVVESQEPPDPSAQNAMPAWTVTQPQQFHPGYYYWPAFGQKPSDAKYCATADDLNKMNIEVTGKPKWPESTPNLRNSAAPTPRQNVPPPPPSPAVIPSQPFQPQPSTSHWGILIFISLIIFAPVLLKLFSSLASRKRQSPPQMEGIPNEIDPQTLCESGEHILPEPKSKFNAMSIVDDDNRFFRARIVLTNRSLIILPDKIEPNQRLFWKIHFSDVIQFHTSYGSTPSPRIIIVSKVPICQLVSYGMQNGSRWFKEHKRDIDIGLIHRVVQKWVKVEYGGSGGEGRKEHITGYYCYVRPEGEFFDPPGHCFCCYPTDVTQEFVGKLSARIVALRSGVQDPSSYEKADKLNNAAPWFFNEETPQFQWQGQPAPEGVGGRVMKGLGGLVGGIARSEGMQDPEGLFPKRWITLRIYLTSHRLIIEITNEKGVEIVEFPAKTCDKNGLEIAGSPEGSVRAVKWNIGAEKAVLEILRDGPWTPPNSTNPKKPGTLGTVKFFSMSWDVPSSKKDMPETGPSLNLPASHLAQFGGWDGFLIGRPERQFVVFDSRPPDVQKLMKTLNARFKETAKPPVMPP